MDDLSAAATDLLIGGRAVPATGGRRFAWHNPITGAVATRAAAASPLDAAAAADAAQAAFAAWSDTGPNARRALLLKAANAFVAAMAGKAGIDAFTELRWITMETQPGHFPI